ncbi:MAG: serine protease [Betaproteobacteria bacterium]|nr:serine protease [Betaproteobacteria bacterium]
MKNINVFDYWQYFQAILLNVIIKCFFLVIGLCFINSYCYAQLEQTIQQVKPSIVGVGTLQKMRAPPVNFLGTGFVVGDGLHVVTNAHVIPEVLDIEKKESVIVITGKGSNPDVRLAEVIAMDKEHDVALLRISGAALPAMQLGETQTVREGRSMAYTGFPIGMVLGFYPVTHQAIVSSITPIILPAHNAKQLDASMIKQLQKSPFMVYQLDGVAYPGNSGSPLYDPQTGIVYGILNMVFVKGKKESALSNPSGISYAIPGDYIKSLMKRIGN